jgi:hypothetical protein
MAESWRGCLGPCLEWSCCNTIQLPDCHRPVEAVLTLSAIFAVIKSPGVSRSVGVSMPISASLIKSQLPSRLLSQAIDDVLQPRACSPALRGINPIRHLQDNRSQIQIEAGAVASARTNCDDAVHLNQKDSDATDKSADEDSTAELEACAAKLFSTLLEPEPRTSRGGRGTHQSSRVTQATANGWLVPKSYGSTRPIQCSWFAVAGQTGPWQCGWRTRCSGAPRTRQIGTMAGACGALKLRVVLHAGVGVASRCLGLSVLGNWARSSAPTNLKAVKPRKLIPYGPGKESDNGETFCRGYDLRSQDGAGRCLRRVWPVVLR